MAFDYSSVKNKKRKDEKTSGFDYSSVVGKTERTEEEKREYVRQQNANKNSLIVTTNAPTKSSNPVMVNNKAAYEK